MFDNISDKNLGKISVIMGIYNCENTLREALDSIIKQTYSNWEIIMCDDGSTDSTFKIAKEYENEYPNKVVILQNEVNKGLNYTLNKCLEVASGQYIARMDGDDISIHNRFEQEVLFLSENPEVAFVSTDMEFFDEYGVWGKTNVSKYPSKKQFIYGTPFCHAPCLVRREAYKSVNGYTESKWLSRVEDYHLWLKMYEKGLKGANLQIVLYKMRDDRNALSRKKFKFRINEAYVKLLVVKKLKLPIFYYIYVFKPIIIGLIPGFLFKKLHHLRHRRG